MHARIWGAFLVSFGAIGCGNSNDSATPDSSVQVDAAPDAAQIPTGFVAIPLTADGGGYTAKMSIGGQPFDVLVDTGSSSTGVASATCTNCNTHPAYTPGTGATDMHFTANSQYGSGSWKGEIYEDAAAMATFPGVPLDFAAITSQTQFFQGGFQGILGLGPDGLLLQHTTSYISKLFASGVTGQLAFQMCPDGGTMWLGGYDQTKAAAPVAFTAQNTSIPYYIVGVGSAQVSGSSMLTSADFGPTIIDTGTTLTYVPAAVVTSVATSVSSSANYSSVFGSQSFTGGACDSGSLTTSMTAAQIDAALPPLQLTFAGGTSAISIPATQSYLANFGGGQWCFTFSDSSQLFGGQKVSLFGNTLLGGMITVFDITNKQIGFALQKGCNEAQRTERLVVRQPPPMRVPLTQLTE
ncbi:MAG: pepsin-like aspartic protease [Kofleriaceae bacterium]